MRESARAGAGTFGKLSVGRNHCRVSARDEKGDPLMSLVITTFPFVQLLLNAAHAVDLGDYAAVTRDLVAVARVERRGCLTHSAAEREVGAPCARACPQLANTCKISFFLTGLAIVGWVQAST